MLVLRLSTVEVLLVHGLFHEGARTDGVPACAVGNRWRRDGVARQASHAAHLVGVERSLTHFVQIEVQRGAVEPLFDQTIGLIRHATLGQRSRDVCTVLHALPDLH